MLSVLRGWEPPNLQVERLTSVLHQRSKDGRPRERALPLVSFLFLLVFPPRAVPDFPRRPPLHSSPPHLRCNLHTAVSAKSSDEVLRCGSHIGSTSMTARSASPVHGSMAHIPGDIQLVAPLVGGYYRSHILEAPSIDPRSNAATPRKHRASTIVATLLCMGGTMPAWRLPLAAAPL